jgi:putative ABC transport system permease protein
MIERLRQDLAFARRSMRRRPGFSLLIVLVLAVGIGTSTAIATVYNAVLLRPLPVRDQDRLVVMWGEVSARKFAHMPLTLGQLRDFARRTRSLSDVGAADYNGAWPSLVRVRGEPFRMMGLPVSGNFFDVLGARALIGRTLRADDDVVGAAGTMVISHAAWRTRFGSDTGVIGRTIERVGTRRSFTIVGVMPAGFEYPRRAEFWAPIHPMMAFEGVENPNVLVDVVGRLAPGASIENARDELSAFFRDDRRPGTLHGATAVARSLPQLIEGDARLVLQMLAAAVGLLLVVACVNVANLLLIRGVERVNELAIRSALGAARGRLARQLLTESALLALVAGLLGALIAVAAIRLLVTIAPAELPRLGEIHVTGVVPWVAATTMVATLLFGVAPAAWVTREGARASLAGATRWGTEAPAARLARDALVAAQVALAVLVLVGAGLVTRSLLRLQRLDMGFTSERLLIAELGGPYDTFTPARVRALFAALIPALEQLPGVAAASPLLITPFSGTGGWDVLFLAEHQRGDASGANPMLNMEAASPTFFRTLGIPVRRGRVFTDQDRVDAVKVAVVSERAARSLWPGDDAVGKRFRFAARDSTLWTVIGVVADTRYRELISPRPTVYFSLAQWPFSYPPTSLVLRTRGDPAAVVPALRRTLAAVAPELVLAAATPMPRLLDVPLAQPRLIAMLLGFFASVVVALAAVGLYGVLAWTVRQRTRELGIRMALGAEPRRVRRLVLRRGMLLAVAGTVAGVLASLGATRVARALLFEISPTDPLTFAGTAALLLVVALGACLLPARRATRVDPVVALRAE